LFVVVIVVVLLLLLLMVVLVVVLVMAHCLQYQLASDKPTPNYVTAV
jgi:hypothetical protein